MQPIIVKTIVHLKDCKRWEKVIEHGGDYNFDGVYMERRVVDVSKAFELIPDNRKYDYKKEDLEEIHDCYYFKHMYFEERFVEHR